MVISYCFSIAFFIISSKILFMLIPSWRVNDTNSLLCILDKAKLHNNNENNKK